MSIEYIVAGNTDLAWYRVFDLTLLTCCRIQDVEGDCVCGCGGADGTGHPGPDTTK